MLPTQWEVIKQLTWALPLQTVYLAGDSTDEEQATGDSEGDEEMLSESGSEEDWDTEEDGGSAEDNDIAE